MAKSGAERQAHYRKKITIGESKRLQFILPLETAIKLDYLVQALQCNKTELLGRIIMEEWARQGEPIPERSRRRRRVTV